MNIRYICWLLCLSEVECLDCDIFHRNFSIAKRNWERYCNLAPATSCFWSDGTSIFISPATTIFSIYPMNFPFFNANGIYWRRARHTPIPSYQWMSLSMESDLCKCMASPWLRYSNDVKQDTSMCSKTHKCIVIYLPIETEYASTELYYWVCIFLMQKPSTNTIRELFAERKIEFWRKFETESARRRF